MNLVVDIGNTRSKLAVFNEEVLVSQYFDLDKLDDLQKKYDVKNGIVSRVGNSLLEFEKSGSINWMAFSHQTPLPFTNKYHTPGTLGLDRIAAVAGCHELAPNQNCLVIDAGTCITYDLLTENAEYLGGAISPGIQMRAKAVNTFTANLPLVSINNEVPLIGRSTEECIQSGIINGAKGEIVQIIRSYKSKFANLQLVMTGGDTNILKNLPVENIIIAPDLVLRGLNRILRHNVQLGK